MSSALTKKVEQYASSIIKKNTTPDLDIISEYAEKIEAIKKYRQKDYEKALKEFLEDELNLYKQKENSGKTIDASSFYILDISKKILEKATQIRRENNRKTSKVDTNILTAPCFFVGRNRELIREGKEKGFITFEQNGVKQLTYHNYQGELLTYNDAKTLIALFALWDEQGYENKVAFTRYQLLNKMNLVDGGRQYQIVSDSIEKLKSTWVILHAAFDVEKGKKGVTRESPLLYEHNTFDNTENGGIRSTVYEIRFSDFMYQSVLNGNYSLISLALFDEIDTDSGKAVYSMITGISNMEDNSLYFNNGFFKLPIDIVYKHLKLENPKPAKNKDIVEKGCIELQNIEVIEEFEFEKNGNRVSSLVIRPSKWFNDLLQKKKQLNSIEHINLAGCIEASNEQPNNKLVSIIEQDHINEHHNKNVANN